MRAGIRISSLVPSGLVIESVSDSSDSIIIAVRAESGVAECPLCGARSSRIHSRYDRQAADLPCAGKEIRFRVITASCRKPAVYEDWMVETVGLELGTHHPVIEPVSA